LWVLPRLGQRIPFRDVHEKKAQCARLEAAKCTCSAFMSSTDALILRL
jgi:hypothetical protein